jgi:hypothetical protein
MLRNETKETKPDFHPKRAARIALPTDPHAQQIVRCSFFSARFMSPGAHREIKSSKPRMFRVERPGIQPSRGRLVP